MVADRRVSSVIVANQRHEMICVLATYTQFATSIFVALHVAMAWHLNVNTDHLKFFNIELRAIITIARNQLQDVHAMQIKVQVVTCRLYASQYLAVSWVPKGLKKFTNELYTSTLVSFQVAAFHINHVAHKH